MTTYSISLPKTIPEELFGNLRSQIYTAGKESLRRSYARVPREGFTQSTSEFGALGNHFFKNLSRDRRSAKSLIRMFGPVVSEYVTSCSDLRHIPGGYFPEDHCASSGVLE